MIERSREGFLHLPIYAHSGLRTALMTVQKCYILVDSHYLTKNECVFVRRLNKETREQTGAVELKSFLAKRRKFLCEMVGTRSNENRNKPCQTFNVG